ncbi:MAG: SGNH/GDSL hydrolase family protein, partial [Chromatiales bacterium]
MKMIVFAALCAATSLGVTPASALTINSLVVFGDSNVDIGRLSAELAGNPADGVIVPPNTVSGRSSDGKILPEFLAERVGVTQLNYGWGGAQAGAENIVGLLLPGATDTLKTGTLSQISEFSLSLGGGTADEDALY